MTTFDDREKAFEAKFAHDEEMAFRVMARRNRLLGEWAAARMGLTPAETDSYYKSVVQADFEAGGDEDMIRKLIGDLNELALADSGALAFKKESVDLPELLIDCLGSFYEKYNNAKISLSVQRCAAAPVFGDASRLQQLFSNLLENSLRYTSAGGSVDINCSRTGSAVVITFDDTPPGVEPTALASLFDPFFRSNCRGLSETRWRFMHPPHVGHALR